MEKVWSPVPSRLSGNVLKSEPWDTGLRLAHASKPMHLRSDHNFHCCATSCLGVALWWFDMSLRSAKESFHVIFSILQGGSRFPFSTGDHVLQTWFPKPSDGEWHPQCLCTASCSRLDKVVSHVAAVHCLCVPCPLYCKARLETCLVVSLCFLNIVFILFQPWRLRLRAHTTRRPTRISTAQNSRRTWSRILGLSLNQFWFLSELAAVSRLLNTNQCPIESQRQCFPTWNAFSQNNLVLAIYLLNLACNVFICQCRKKIFDLKTFFLDSTQIFSFRKVSTLPLFFIADLAYADQASPIILAFIVVAQTNIRNQTILKQKKRKKNATEKKVIVTRCKTSPIWVLLASFCPDDCCPLCFPTSLPGSAVAGKRPCWMPKRWIGVTDFLGRASRVESCTCCRCGRQRPAHPVRTRADHHPLTLPSAWSLRTFFFHLVSSSQGYASQSVVVCEAKYPRDKSWQWVL